MPGVHVLGLPVLVIVELLALFVADQLRIPGVLVGGVARLQQIISYRKQRLPLVYRAS